MASPVNSSSLMKRINRISSRPRTFRVAVLGQNGVGKTALAVRFVTRRYIGDYDPLLERIYSCQRTINGTSVEFEVWDTAGLNENSKLKEHIRWADAIVLMYDITDRCSFNECSRLKFLVNAHSRRTRRKTGSDPNLELLGSIPVAMVANKKDKDKDRMVPPEEGATRSAQLNCISFNELSVREDVDDVMDIFKELYSLSKRPPRSRFLGTSKSFVTLNVGKTGSSSDDEHEEKDGGERGGSSCGRRGTFSASPPEADTVDDLIKRSKFRRREAFFTIS